MLTPSHVRGSYEDLGKVHATKAMLDGLPPTTSTAGSGTPARAKAPMSLGARATAATGTQHTLSPLELRAMLAAPAVPQHGGRRRAMSMPVQMCRRLDPIKEEPEAAEAGSDQQPSIMAMLTGSATSIETRPRSQSLGALSLPTFLTTAPGP
jgi:hypothetical protein